MSEKNPEVPLQNPENGSNRIKNKSVDVIEADKVHMQQSGAASVKASAINAAESFIGDSTTETLEINNGFTAIVNANQATINSGGVGVLSTNEADVNGNVGITLAKSVRMHESRSGIIIAREVHGSKIKTVFLFANRVGAPIETIVEPRSIALFGAAAGLVFGLFYGLFHWMRSRS